MAIGLFMEKTIHMKRDKDCKHSVRFATDDEKEPVQSVYVSRSIPAVETAREITVTIAIGE